MKRLALLLLLLCPISLLAQGVRFDSTVNAPASNFPPGTPAPLFSVPNAQITVNGTIYSDQAMTQVITQPLIADLNGNFGFYVAPGTYVYTVATSLGSVLGSFPLTLDTALAATIPGTATGRTDTTPLSSSKMTDGSALNTSGAMQGDAHLTPYTRADITVTGPNDDAAYESFLCNYTGTGATGNCIPHFFVAGNTAGDKHTGIWGGNSIISEHANTSSFGWEVNTFNYYGNGDILANGTYTAGPFFGFAATATSGTGYYNQQAAFIANNNNLGGSGGGWDYGLYVTNANNAGVLCGVPANASLPYCIQRSALGTATSIANYASEPDIDYVNTWTGTANGIHSVTTQSVPGTGTNPQFCKTFSFDGTTTSKVCSDGQMQNNGPVFFHAASGGQTLTLGQLYADTANPGQLLVSVDGSGNGSIQAIQQGVANKTLSLNSAGGTVTVNGSSVCTTATGCGAGISENAVTSSTTALSATATLNTVTLAANYTFTLAAGAGGAKTCLLFVQGATAYTVTPPANVVGFFTVGTTVSKRNAQCFTYSTSQSVWVPQSTGIVNF